MNIYINIYIYVYIHIYIYIYIHKYIYIYICKYTYQINTEVWFRDVSLKWHYLCANFTCLLRIMVTHLGKKYLYVFTCIYMYIASILICLYIITLYTCIYVLYMCPFKFFIRIMVICLHLWCFGTCLCYLKTIKFIHKCLYVYTNMHMNVFYEWNVLGIYCWAVLLYLYLLLFVCWLSYLCLWLVCVFV
jgi:hypothetical protein